MEYLSDLFLIPVAFDKEGRCHRPETAPKGAFYRCPDCKERVVVRRGEVVAAHFAHYADQESNCNPETVLHNAGKQSIVNVIAAWKAGWGKKPEISMVHYWCKQETFWEIPDEVETTIVEHRLPSGRILDVALMKAESVLLGVEIYVTHRVDAEKKSQVQCPWVELDAEILIDAPLQWRCRQQNGCFLECDCCRELARAYYAEIQRIQEARVSSPRYENPPTYQVPRFEPRPQAPIIAWGGSFHPTTLITEEKVEFSLSKMPGILDLIEAVPGQLSLPGGGAVDGPEFETALRESLRDTKDMRDDQKRALLWKLSEYLMASRSRVKGSGGEKDKNRAAVEEAIGWLKDK